MDYRLVDSQTDKGGDEFYSERLVRLDGSFLCFDPSPEAPAVSSLPGGASGSVTFGAFNSMQKLTELNVRMWSKVLSELPSSRLLIKAVPLGEQTLAEALLDRFEKNGVTRDRIDVRGITPKREDHLSLYSKVDIHFDTFPYNGTTTTCEAAWQGVPTLTLAGEQHRSRVGLSILHQLNMDDWVAFSEQEFVEKAVAKARDIGGLAQLRSGLRQKIAESPLTDGPAFVAALEREFDKMVESVCLA